MSTRYPLTGEGTYYRIRVEYSGTVVLYPWYWQVTIFVDGKGSNVLDGYRATKGRAKRQARAIVRTHKKRQRKKSQPPYVRFMT